MRDIKNRWAVIAGFGFSYNSYRTKKEALKALKPILRIDARAHIADLRKVEQIVVKDIEGEEGYGAFKS